MILVLAYRSVQGRIFGKQLFGGHVYRAAAGRGMRTGFLPVVVDSRDNAAGIKLCDDRGMRDADRGSSSERRFAAKVELIERGGCCMFL